MCVGHSNSERGYLWSVMQEQLREEVQKVWAEARREGRAAGGIGDGGGGKNEKEGNGEKNAEEGDEEDEVTVAVSERDRDPFGIVVLNG